MKSVPTSASEPFSAVAFAVSGFSPPTVIVWSSVARQVVMEVELVARRRHEHRAARGGVAGGAVEGGRVRVGAEAHAHHARPAVGRIDDRLGEPARLVEDVVRGAHRQDRGSGGDARHAPAVVGGGAQHTGDVRAVACAVSDRGSGRARRSRSRASRPRSRCGRRRLGWSAGRGPRPSVPVSPGLASQRPARSAWSRSTPTSMSAIETPAPVVSGQARSAEIPRSNPLAGLARSHCSLVALGGGWRRRAGRWAGSPGRPPGRLAGRRRARPPRAPLPAGERISRLPGSTSARQSIVAAPGKLSRRRNGRVVGASPRASGGGRARSASGCRTARTARCLPVPSAPRRGTRPGSRASGRRRARRPTAARSSCRSGGEARNRRLRRGMPISVNGCATGTVQVATPGVGGQIGGRCSRGRCGSRPRRGRWRPRAGSASGDDDLARAREVERQLPRRQPPPAAGSR